MEKRKLKITLTTNNQEKKFQAISNFNNGEILYLEDNNLPTLVILNYKNKILIRENKDIKIELVFKQEEETVGNILLKEENKNFDLKIKTDKWYQDNNKIEIIYTILDSMETISYKLEF